MHSCMSTHHYFIITMTGYGWWYGPTKLFIVIKKTFSGLNLFWSLDPLEYFNPMRFFSSIQGFPYLLSLFVFLLLEPSKTFGSCEPFWFVYFCIYNLAQKIFVFAGRYCAKVDRTKVQRRQKSSRKSQMAFKFSMY